jgi:hypothetical protein
MQLLPNVIVLAAETRGPVGGKPIELLNQSHGRMEQDLTILLCIPFCPHDIPEIGLATCRVGIKIPKSSGGQPRVDEMMVPNRLSHRSRPAMHHEPKGPILFSLKFKKVIATPQRAELNTTLAALQFL